LKHLIAVLLSVAVLVGAPAARAEGGTSPEERASCQQRLKPAEEAIASDYKYARAWTDSWTVISSGLVILNLTQAFMVDDYKRWESLTFAVTSLALQIQRPLALTSNDSLKQIQTAAVQDPCLALADASHVFKSNQVDGELHRAWPIHVINIGFNLAVAAVLALASGHFDVWGDSNLGLQTAAGIVLAEAYTFTYPKGSFRTTGTSAQWTF
jgi:hypothetical protein